MGAGASAAAASGMGRDVLSSFAPSTSSSSWVAPGPRRGDLLCFQRGLYSHWGVCLGTGDELHAMPALPESLRGSLHPTTTYVGHLSAVAAATPGRGGDFGGRAHMFVTKAIPLARLRDMIKPSVELLHGYDPLDALADAEPEVMMHTLDAVARNGPVEVANERYDAYFAEANAKRPLPPDETVARSLRCLGLRGYSLLGRNCEHFASWLRYGVAKSMQVDAARSAARSAAAALGAAVGGAAVMATGGAVAVAVAVAVGGGACCAVAVAAETTQGRMRRRFVPPAIHGGRRSRGSLYLARDGEGVNSSRRGADGAGDTCAAMGGGGDSIGSEWEGRQSLATRENRL